MVAWAASRSSLSLCFGGLSKLSSFARSVLFSPKYTPSKPFLASVPVWILLPETQVPINAHFISGSSLVPDWLTLVSFYLREMSLLTQTITTLDLFLLYHANVSFLFLLFSTDKLKFYHNNPCYLATNTLPYNLHYFYCFKPKIILVFLSCILAHHHTTCLCW